MPSPDHTPDCNARCPPDTSAIYLAICLAHIFVVDAPASLFNLLEYVCVLPFVPPFYKAKQDWKIFDSCGTQNAPKPSAASPA